MVGEKLKQSGKQLAVQEIVQLCLNNGWLLLCFMVCIVYIGMLRFMNRAPPLNMFSFVVRNWLWCNGENMCLAWRYKLLAPTGPRLHLMKIIILS